MRDNRNKVPTVIKYNWEILKQYSNDNVHKILEFFDSIYIRKTENYFYLNSWAAKAISHSSSNSHNYIQNIPGLLEGAKNATDSEIYVYLDLASKRSYFSFINTKGKMNYLPKWKVGDYDVNTLQTNRLLTFDDNNIYLLYEGD